METLIILLSDWCNISMLQCNTCLSLHLKWVTKWIWLFDTSPVSLLFPLFIETLSDAPMSPLLYTCMHGHKRHMFVPLTIYSNNVMSDTCPFSCRPVTHAPATMYQPLHRHRATNAHSRIWHLWRLLGRLRRKRKIDLTGYIRVLGGVHLRSLECKWWVKWESRHSKE